MNLTFQEPPTESGKKKYVAVAKTLRENPGKWAVIDLGHLAKSTISAFPSNLHRGSMSAFPPAEFEAMAREGVTYIRFIGNTE